MTQPTDWSALVSAVLAEMPVIDGHNDLPAVLRTQAGYSVAGLDQIVPNQQTDLVRLRQGGVGAQFWSAWVPTGSSEAEAVVATLEQIDAIHRLTAAYPDQLAFARTAADIEAAWSEGKLACLIGVEGGHSIAESLGVLRGLARLGVRYLTLTHGSNTSWADSATDTPQLGGLNDEGLAIVAELNRIGVLVDLSHTSPDTQRAVLAATDVPVIFSHSSALAVAGHPRNIPDDVLGTLAGNGGVAQVTFVADFLTDARRAWSEAAMAWVKAQAELADVPFFPWASAPRPGQTSAQAMARQRQTDGDGPSPLLAALTAYSESHPLPPVTVDDLVAHVEHVREVAGIDHIGLGGDYDGTPSLPQGMEDVTGYRRLLEALASRGWSRHDLMALTGGNVLRVLRAAEEAASEPLYLGRP
ncbi:MAG: dipeptidase [Propionibacteriaceae bacterium]|jgi:membrane dipeptidase|nr:dipeptidase [Propionibacteriaceae bacterium]